MSVGAARTLGQAVGRGAAWSVANSVVLRLGSFLMGIVVARLVAPDAFGVFAVALTVHAIIVNASELGVAAALVRSKTDEAAPTVATIALASSTLLAVVMWLSAPALGGLLGSASAAEPIRILSLTVVLAGISAVPVALLTREFRQDRMFLADAVNFCASTGTLLALAVPHLEVTGLAWSRVAGQLAATVLLVAKAPVRTRPGYDPAQARALLRFGVPLAAASMVGYGLGNYDYVVVGHLLGAVPLGLYTLAYNIAGWPVSVFSAVAANVAMPAVARVRDDKGRLALRIVSLVAALSAVVLPVSALTMALSGPLVQVVYGSRWGGATTALASLAAFGTIRVLIALFGAVFVALGLTRQLFAIQLAWLGLLVPVMYVGVRQGELVGAGLAHIAVGAVLVIPLHLLLLNRVVQVTGRQLVTAVLPPLGAAAVAGSAAFGASAVLTDPALGLLAGAAVGTLLYVLLLRTWLLRTATEVRQLWREPEATGAADTAAAETTAAQGKRDQNQAAATRSGG